MNLSNLLRVYPPKLTNSSAFLSLSEQFPSKTLLRLNAAFDIDLDMIPPTSQSTSSSPLQKVPNTTPITSPTQIKQEKDPNEGRANPLVLKTCEMIFSDPNIKPSSQLITFIHSCFSQNQEGQPSALIYNKEIPEQILEKIGEVVPQVKKEAQKKIEAMEKEKQSLEGQVKEDLRKILMPICHYYSDGNTKIETMITEILKNGAECLVNFKGFLSVTVREQLLCYLKSEKWKDLTDKQKQENDFSFGMRMIEETGARKHQISPHEEKKEIDFEEEGSIPEENNDSSMKISEINEEFGEECKGLEENGIIVEENVKIPVLDEKESGKINKKISKKIMKGQKFQVLNGQSKHFSYDFLKKVFQDPNCIQNKIKVVSLLGFEPKEKLELFPLDSKLHEKVYPTQGVYGFLVSPETSSQLLVLEAVQEQDDELAKKSSFALLSSSDEVMMNVSSKKLDQIVTMIEETLALLETLDDTDIPLPDKIFLVQGEKNSNLLKNPTIEKMLNLSSYKEKFTSSTMTELKKMNLYDPKRDNSPRNTEKRNLFESLSHWLDRYYSIYTLIEKDMDLKQFKELEQKIQEETVQDWIKENLSIVLGEENKRKMFNVTKSPDKNIAETFQKMKEKILEDFKRFSAREGLSNPIYERSVNNIKKIFNTTLDIWIEEFSTKTQDDYLSFVKKSSEKNIAQTIEGLLQRCETDPENPKEAFNAACEQELEKIKSSYNRETYKQQTLKSVHSRIKIYEPTIPSLQDIKFYVSRAEKFHNAFMIFNDRKLFDQVKDGKSPKINDFAEVKFNYGFFNEKYLKEDYQRSKGTLSMDQTQSFIYTTREKLLKKALEKIHGKYLNFKKIHDELKIEVDFITKNEKGIRKMNQELIQKIISFITEKMLQKIIQESEIFGIVPNNEFVNALYILAISFIYENYDKKNDGSFNDVLDDFREFCKTKENILTIQLESKDSMDIDLRTARFMCERLVKIVNDSIKQHGMTKFDEVLKFDNKVFTRFSIQREIDLNLQDQPEEFLYRYIMKPTVVIEEKFEEIFLAHSSQVFKYMMGYMNEMKGFLESIRKRTESLSKDFSQKTNFTGKANDLFSSKSKEITPMILFGQATLRFIFQLLSNRVSESMQLSNRHLSLTIPLKDLPTAMKFKKSDAKLLDELERECSLYSIQNLKVFLDFFNKELEKVVITKSLHIPTLFDIDRDDLYKRYKERAIGCYMTCPCCNRPCDAEHYIFPNIAIGTEGNRHKCSLGHQLRGMNGYRVLKCDEPSLNTCENMRENSLIYYNRVCMTWKQFKQKFKNWDFETIHLSKEELLTMKEKFNFVWKKIGRKLCQEFRMNYVEKNSIDPNTDMIGEYHHILILDRSGSMTGNRWASLHEGVVKFVKIRACEDTNDTISCITFSDKAEVLFENIQASKIELKDLGRTGGSTSYSAGLKGLMELIQKYRNSGRKFNVVFMSDGEATDDPSETLIQFKKMCLMDVSSFWAVGYGQEGTEYLKSIAKMFNGTFKNPKDGFELKEVFVEIARS